MRYFRRCFYIFLSITFGTTYIGKTQGLPNTQKVSLRAPKNIKMDGRASEWNNQFKAYNKATQLYYTISNDDDNLYLILQISDPYITTKVVNSGLRFMIKNPNQKKYGEENVIIGFPVYENKQKPLIALKKNKSEADLDSLASVKAASDRMTINNNRLTEKTKYISVYGIKGLDSLISIYNEENIKAAQALDINMYYTCEISLPLKRLGLSVNGINKFQYGIKVLGLDNRNISGITYTTNETGSPTSITIAPGTLVPNKGNILSLVSDTDFSGEYTLAKKP